MNPPAKPNQAEIVALQQDYKSALLSVDISQAEAVLRHGSNMLATPLDVAELCLAPVLEQLGEAWENGHLALSQIYMASRISEELVERLLPSPQEMHGETAPRIALALYWKIITCWESDWCSRHCVWPGFRYWTGNASPPRT
jgi:methanogenic corrinoid protein MtbC1